MIDVNLLDKAITAHASWKNRLRTAVSSGEFDTPVATVKADNQSEFGKWMCGASLTAADKQSETYRTVRDLHAKFHQDAAKVVELATSGQKQEADKAIGLGGFYAKSSSTLTEAMIRWRNNLR